MKHIVHVVGGILLLLAACIDARAGVILVDTAELGEAFAGYFGFAAGSRHPTPYRFFIDPISATQLDFPPEIVQPRIDVDYRAGRALDQGPAESAAEIDARITSVAGEPDRIRRVDIFSEASAMAPASTGNDDHYVSSGLVQFAFLFEVVDEAVRLSASGALFADPYASSELRVARMDADNYTPPSFPDVESLMFRARTGSTQTVESSVNIDTSVALEPGLYFLYSTTSALRGPNDPGSSLATLNAEILFGGGAQRWIDPAGGLYSDGDNWESTLAPRDGDPLLFDLVNSGYVVAMDTDAQAGELAVPQGTVSLAFNGNAGSAMTVDGTVTVGETAGVRGGLDIIGGNLSADTVQVAMASGADGLLTLREGAVLDFRTLLVGQADSTAAQFYALSGASLTVEAGDRIAVSGAGTEFGVEELVIGEPGTGGGTLSVDGGALATIDRGLDLAAGEVAVTGGDNGRASTLEVAAQSGGLTVGEEATLAVSGGGVLRVGDPFGNTAADLRVNAVLPEPDEVTQVADFPGAAPPPTLLPEAAVTIAGQDSVAYVFGMLAVGVEHTGALSVSDGGALLATRIVLGSDQEPGINGSLVLTGNGSALAASEVLVGERDAGIGYLRIEQDASAEIARALDIDNGEVRVTGGPLAIPGTDAPPQLLVGTDLEGRISVGDQGRLVVADAARVEIGTSAFDLAADLFVDADSTGNGPAPVLVTGEGSALLANRRLVIGEISDGHMQVAAGGALAAIEITLGSALFGGIAGQLDAFGAASEVFAHRVQLGDVNAGSGTLTVTAGAAVDVLERLDLIRSNVLVDGGEQGTDSRLFVAEANPDGGEILVGRHSRFTVSDGAVVEVGAAGIPGSRVVVEASAPSNEAAPFLVTGEGSRVLVFGDMVVGLFDNGVAGVADGATLLASNLSIGPVSQVTSELTVAGPGSSLTAATANVGGAESGAGTLELMDGAEAQIGQRLVVNSEGAVFVGDGSTLVVGNDPAAAAVPGSVLVAGGGELWGSGDIFADVFNGGGVNSLGSVYPGSSPGTLTIHGDYVQGAGGRLIIEVGGAGADTQHDVLNVLGDVSIAGEVLFEFVDGFLPRQGQQFDFLAAQGSVDLTQALVRAAGLAPGFQFDIQASANGFRMLALNDASPVPLPPAAMLLLSALAVLHVRRRRPGGTLAALIH